MALPSPAPAPTPPPAPSLRPPEASAGGPVISPFQKAAIPKPTLPRHVAAGEGDQLNRACQLVESALVSNAGLLPQYARGITAGLRHALGGKGDVYPVAMYYFLVREAALKHDNRTAAANLASAQGNGALLKFRDLPAVDSQL
jgi:hypothetical protein